MIKIPNDKIIHFLGGGCVASVTLGLTGDMYMALIAVFAVGTGKEIWDAMGYGTPDIWDAIATYLGALILLAWVIPNVL